MAEVLVNHTAHERGLLVRAESAGTGAGATTNPVVVEGMREMGVSMDGLDLELLASNPPSLVRPHSGHNVDSKRLLFGVRQAEVASGLLPRPTPCGLVLCFDTPK